MNRISTMINKDKMLQQLVITCNNVRLASQNADIGVTQFYQWLKDDEDFLNDYIEILKGIRKFGVTKQMQKIYSEDPVALATLVKRANKKLQEYHAGNGCAVNGLSLN
jgi:hypothetical protein